MTRTESANADAPHVRHALIVVLAALVAGLSGLFVAPPLDRDESRFVQATTQMLESGDYVRIRYQETERNKKPVGIHWLQAGSVAAFSDVEARAVWAYRLPSLAGAMLAAFGTYLAGCALFGRRAGLIAGLLIACAPVVAAEASIAKTDAALLACVVLAQAALARLWIAEDTGTKKGPLLPALGFWAALSAGILIKGPIAPMVSGLTILALVLATRRVRWLLRLRPALGLPLLLLLVLPWFVAIGLATDGRFYAEAVGRDMLGKVGEAQESHAGPFGYHTILLWVMFWPAALFLPAALRWAAPRFGDPSVLFGLAWFAPAFLVFEAAGTKLPHYPMVTYPGLALLVGALLTSDEARRFAGFRFAGAGLFALVGLAAAGGVLYLLAEHHDRGVTPLSVALVVAVAALIVLTVITALRGALPRAAYLAAATSAALAWVLFQHTLPRLDELALTPRLASLLHEAEAHPRLDAAPPVALVGYHEPSAVFLLGTDTRLTDAEGAAEWLRGGAGRVAVVEARERPAFLRAVAGTPFEELGQVAGRNYSNGDDARLVVVRSR